MTPWLPDALLRSQTDERLAALARAGNERAFTVVVERYRGPLRAFARRLVAEPRVDDVLQQAFLGAWTALRDGAEVRHMRGWLHQIVRNSAVRVLAATPIEDEIPESLAGAAGVLDQVEERLLVEQTLADVAALPDRQRAALVQTAVQGRSRAEVASSLGLTEGAVRQLIHRARTALRTAATAVTPLPLATWAANASLRAGGQMDGLASIAAGAGSASSAGIVIKAGVIAAATGAITVGAAQRHVHQVRAHHRAAVAHVHRAAAPAVAPVAAPAQVAVVRVRGPRPAAATTRGTEGTSHPVAAQTGRDGGASHRSGGTVRHRHSGDKRDVRPVPIVAPADASDSGDHNSDGGDSHGSGSGDGSDGHDGHDGTATTPVPAPVPVPDGSSGHDSSGD